MSEPLNDGDVVEEIAVIAPQPQVGQQLRLAREARGLSVLDVAQTLKLGSRQLEALESGDWGTLPGNTFVRGFVRNYARIVQIDPTPLMTLLDGVLVKPASNLAVNEQSLSQMPQTGRAVSGRDRMVMFAGFCLLVLAALAYFLLASNLSAWRDGLQELLDSVARKDEPVAVAVQPASSEPVFPPGATPQQIMNPQSLPAAPVENSVGSSASPTPASASGADAKPGQIRFTVDKESWVEIRDRDNKPVFSQRVAPGVTQDLNGQGPFSLVVGYAPGVKVYWHGQLVDLAPHTRGDVARLVLE
jgi:cytoskeleton protein RodZ